MLFGFYFSFLTFVFSLRLTISFFVPRLVCLGWFFFFKSMAKSSKYLSVWQNLRSPLGNRWHLSWCPVFLLWWKEVGFVLHPRHRFHLGSSLCCSSGTCWPFPFMPTSTSLSCSLPPFLFLLSCPSFPSQGKLCCLDCSRICEPTWPSHFSQSRSCKFRHTLLSREVIFSIYLSAFLPPT